MNILHLETSPRGTESHSRQVAEKLVAALRQAKPDATVTYRDLNDPVVPHVSGDWVRAATYGAAAGQAQTDATRATLALSDTLVAELQAADMIVLATPMYNFSVPSVAKAYIDHVVRIGVTVQYTATGPVDQVTGKKMFAGGGGYGKGAEREIINFADSLIQTAFGFIGITDVTLIPVEGTLGGDESVQKSHKKADEQIAKIVAAL